MHPGSASAVPLVPKWLVVLLAFAVVGSLWHVGTKDYDFLSPPTATEIERARTRASQKLATPSNLFAVNQEPQAQRPVEETRPAEPPPKEPPPPVISFGKLTDSPPLDAWFELKEMPAASFIDLASRLEADTNMAWARVAWERVIDRTKADDDQLQAAIKGVQRTRLSPTPPDTPGRPTLQLRVLVPSDRIQVSRRAAEAAAKTLSDASSGLIGFEAEAKASSELDDELEISLGRGDRFPQIRIKAPSRPEHHEEAFLGGVFRLLISQLATNPELEPVSVPLPGEKPSEALANRITRLAWSSFASAYDPS